MTLLSLDGLAAKDGGRQSLAAQNLLRKGHAILLLGLAPHINGARHVRREGSAPLPKGNECSVCIALDTLRRG